MSDVITVDTTLDHPCPDVWNLLQAPDWYPRFFRGLGSCEPVDEMCIRDRSFTRALARELGSRGITANTVQPGPIDTDMNPKESDHAETLNEITALGRYGHTDDVAAVVSFLAGPESGYVTGAHWNVDGGLTA